MPVNISYAVSERSYTYTTHCFNKRRLYIMKRKKINLCEGMDIYYVSYESYDLNRVYNYLSEELNNDFGNKKAERITSAMCNTMFHSHEDSKTEEVIITDSKTMTIYRLKLDGKQPKFENWIPFEDALERGFAYEDMFKFFIKALNASYTYFSDAVLHEITDSVSNDGKIKLNNREILIISKHTYLKNMLREEFNQNKVDEILSHINNEILFKASSNFYTIAVTDTAPVLIPNNNVFSIAEDILSKMGYSKTETEDIIIGTPDWMPLGYSHKTGTLETGYVIADDKGNEYVYIPSGDYYVSRYIISKGKDNYPMSISGKEPWCNLTLNEAAEIVCQKVQHIDDSFDIKSCFKKDSLGVAARILSNYRSLTNFLNVKVRNNPTIKRRNYIYNIYFNKSITCFTYDLTNFADYEDVLYAKTMAEAGLDYKNAKALEYTGQKVYVENNELKLQTNKKEDIIYADTTKGMGFRIILMRPSTHILMCLNPRPLQYTDSEETLEAEKAVSQLYEESKKSGKFHDEIILRGMDNAFIHYDYDDDLMGL